MGILIAPPKSPAPYPNRPQSPYRYRAAGPPVLSDHVLVRALQTIPIGLWVSADLNTLPGSTPKRKKLAAAQAAAKFFTPVQVQTEGRRIFARRVPEAEPYNLPKLARRVFTGHRNMPLLS
jgi:hypothetical protein